MIGRVFETLNQGFHFCNINPNQHGGGWDGIKTTGVRTLAILSRMKVGVSILHVITIFGV